MATTPDSRGDHRPRRPHVSVEVRPMPATMSTDELRRRERDLERLIVQAGLAVLGIAPGPSRRPGRPHRGHASLR